MGNLFQQLADVFRHFWPPWRPDMVGLMDTLGQPEMFVTALIALNIVVFTETGLLVGFFLPGDSLLVTAGIVAVGAGWNLPLLIGTLCLSAIIGDSVGYAIGYRTGPTIFRREESFWFRKSHLLAAQSFYEKHGGKTIVLARFMPLVRTFAPVVAGVARMDYSKFLFFNIFGGVGWVASMILLGYYLPSVIDPPFKKIFGPDFEIRTHIEKVIIVVVLISISPGIVAWWRARSKRKNQPTELPTAV